MLKLLLERNGLKLQKQRKKAEMEVKIKRAKKERRERKKEEKRRVGRRKRRRSKQGEFSEIFSLISKLFRLKCRVHCLRTSCLWKIDYFTVEINS